MKKCKKDLHEYEGKFRREYRKIWKLNKKDLIRASGRTIKQL
jgi:hypothetical protein